LTYRTEYTLGFLALLPLLATGVAKGTGWLVTIIVVYVGIPLLIWSLLVDRLAFLALRIICRLRESSDISTILRDRWGSRAFRVEF